MARTKISEYDATASNNTDVNNINIAEGCPPSGINNAIREVMAHMKDLYEGNTTDALTLGGGGTGAKNAADARTNLGVGTLGTYNEVETAIIKDKAVTTAKINDGAVSGVQIATGVVLQGDPQTTTQAITDNSDKIATTAFVQNLIGGAASAKGYIAFNGSTGSVIASENCSLTKVGTGNYTINLDASIQDGSDDYCVVVGAVDEGTLSRGGGITTADNTLRLYNAFVRTRTVSNFNLRAVKVSNDYQIFAAADGDGNATQMFTIAAINPTYVALAIYK